MPSSIDAPCLSQKQINGRSVRVVDYPGHPRLRARLRDALDRARCVVFLLDSTEFPAQTQEVAELLMDVLTDRGIARSRVPVLLACHKQDLNTKAYSVDFIRRKLEKTLDSLRTSRGALAESGAAKGKGGGTGASAAAASGAGTDLLGKKGEPFTFAGCAGARVSVAAAGTSVAGEPGLGALRDFLRASL
jgi:signal recognition particle receptor subunit beta